MADQGGKSVNRLHQDLAHKYPAGCVRPIDRRLSNPESIPEAKRTDIAHLSDRRVRCVNGGRIPGQCGGVKAGQ
jgi:hypothetical protein